MVCSNPIVLTSSTGAEYSVPCGKCLCCRAAKSKEWTVRLLHEQSQWETDGFLTLTYDDKHLPEGGKLSVPKKDNASDLQLFFKRFRKILGNRRIKYFACGEYGSHTFRPHYHAIVFGADARDLHLVKSAWYLGDRVSFDPVFPGGIAYVCGYVRKKIALQYKIYADKGLPFPFQLQSKGLGLKWAEENKSLIESHGIQFQGRHFGIPRYYVKKLDLSCDTFYSELDARLADRDQELLDKGFEEMELYDILVKSNIQRGVNASALQRLKGL